MTIKVGNLTEFDGEKFLVTQITSRPKDGSLKVVLQQILPLEGVDEVPEE